MMIIIGNKIRKKRLEQNNNLVDINRVYTLKTFVANQEANFIS